MLRFSMARATDGADRQLRGKIMITFKTWHVEGGFARDREGRYVLKLTFTQGRRRDDTVLVRDDSGLFTGGALIGGKPFHVRAQVRYGLEKTTDHAYLQVDLYSANKSEIAS